MIRYALCCGNGHDFEAWFSGSADFDAQAARGLVGCAVCGSTDVHKALMAPSVKRTDRGRGSQEISNDAPEVSAQYPVAAAAGPGMPEQVRDALRQLRKAVVENSDYVGPGFVEEARKIHYGEAPVRGIYGEASADDTRALEEEGIEVYPLPHLPEDQN
ncbi:MAG: DUF1178 family protein [Rhodobiaceae bacterium]|nr:DUF1178 family protein [Rhodobiaceae bacterium]